MSRGIFWFLVGAGVATWWNKHKVWMNVEFNRGQYHAPMIQNNPHYAARPQENEATQPAPYNAWDAERGRRFMELGRQAEETVSMMSFHCVVNV